MTVSAKDDGHGLFDRLAEYLGVDISSTPVVLYMSKKQEKFRFDASEITLETITSFVGRVQSGELEAFYKSAEIPATNDEPVKILVGKSFKDVVLNSDK